MKRLYSIIFLVFLTMSVVAQQRMNFLGQPLGCSLTTFKQRMDAKGYKYKGEEETNIYTFDGVFGGEKVELGVFVTPKSKIVYQVGVSFLSYEYKGYDSAKEKYLLFKKRELIDSFTKKYGNPTITFEAFTFWYFDYGKINISNNVDRNNKNSLFIMYTDYASEEKHDREQESDY